MVLLIIAGGGVHDLRFRRPDYVARTLNRAESLGSCRNDRCKRILS
jgi:hypothetical protein